MQIRALRKSRAMTQEQLAQNTGTKQEAVSRIENSDYGKYSLDTLIKLASAFDIALEVAFVPFSRLINRLVFRRTEGLDVCSYSADVELNVLIQDSATIITDTDFLHKSRPRKGVSIQYSGSGIQHLGSGIQHLGSGNG